MEYGLLSANSWVPPERADLKLMTLLSLDSLLSLFLENLFRRLPRIDDLLSMSVLYVQVEVK